MNNNSKQIQYQIEIINYHLSSNKDSFLLDLHEHLNFNNIKFIELINALKFLKKQKIKPCDIGNNFISNLLERITYMYDILRDLFIHSNNLNIGIDKYYESILEIKYEILSLFNDSISIDFHGNKY